MDGRGSDEGSAKARLDHVGGQLPVSGPEDGPGWRERRNRCGEPEAACPQGTRRLLRGARQDVAPIGAPLPHAVRGKQRKAAPRASPRTGRCESAVTLFENLTSVFDHRKPPTAVHAGNSRPTDGVASLAYERESMQCCREKHLRFESAASLHGPPGGVPKSPGVTPSLLTGQRSS